MVLILKTEVGDAKRKIFQIMNTCTLISVFFLEMRVGYHPLANSFYNNLISNC